jgi:hypothetical protein
MLDAITYAGIGFGVGAGAGAVSAYLGWNASGEPFDARKFLNGMITGVLAGIALVFANLMAFKAVGDEFAVLELYGTIIAGAIGIDMARAKVTAMISSRNETDTPPVVQNTSKDAV